MRGGESQGEDERGLEDIVGTDHDEVAGVQVWEAETEPGSHRGGRKGSPGPGDYFEMGGDVARAKGFSFSRAVRVSDFNVAKHVTRREESL